MTEDFLRLVSQANPAALPTWSRQQQYQPANNKNLRSEALMDPFFDDHDEDDNVPDSAFGPIPAQGPSRSQESQLPLSHNAAPPAGREVVVGGSVSDSQTKGLPQGWNFDDDDFISGNSEMFPGSSNYPPPPTKKPNPENIISRLKKQKWKWPWKKEQTLTGERVVALNNSLANGEFCSNYVSTSKYNLFTFLPKFLFGKRVRPLLPLLIYIQYRTIFEIRQFVLPLHCMYSTNSWCISNESIYDHRTSCGCPTCVGT